ncbi:MAG: hypothetical protein HC802_02905 [Caldilineaceae bacterium]|nr:hypothetical protein [Caldilineaceae bacterium]
MGFDDPFFAGREQQRFMVIQLDAAVARASIVTGSASSLRLAIRQRMV